MTIWTPAVSVGAPSAKLTVPSTLEPVIFFNGCSCSTDDLNFEGN